MKMNDLVHNEERLKQLRERAKELIGQMTLEEKVYQTLYNAPAIERLGIASYNWWNEALHGVARAGTGNSFSTGNWIWQQRLMTEFHGADWQMPYATEASCKI